MNRLRKRHTWTYGFWCALGIATMQGFTCNSAQAGLIWDNGAPVFPSRNITNLISADDFVLSTTTTLESLRVWISDGTFNPSFPSYSGSIGWGFYSEGGGKPGVLLSSGLDHSAVIAPNPGKNWFQFDIHLGSVVLGPGTYWIALHEGGIGAPDDGSAIYWLRSVTRHGDSLKSASNLTNPGWAAAPSDSDLAFQLSGTVAPEPSTLAASGMAGILGLVQLFAYRVRQKSSRMLK